MEYLMTYGWAILIISVVLAALFQLGASSACAAAEPGRLVAHASNSNDYSGNGSSGAPTNVVYTSSWSSGYTLR